MLSIVSTGFLTVFNFRTDQPQVVLGAHRIQETESSQKILQGRRPIVHEGWDSNTLRNDISLIELPQAVETNRKCFIFRVKSRDLLR